MPPAHPHGQPSRCLTSETPTILKGTPAGISPRASPPGPGLGRQGVRPNECHHILCGPTTGNLRLSAPEASLKCVCVCTAAGPLSVQQDGEACHAGSRGRPRLGDRSWAAPAETHQPTSTVLRGGFSSAPGGTDWRTKVKGKPQTRNTFANSSGLTSPVQSDQFSPTWQLGFG